MDANGAPNRRKGVSLPNSNNMALPPVAPRSAGEGLPYAPVWPNAGDVWGWKVGKWNNRSACFQRRSLIVPRHLALQPYRGPRLALGSRLDVEQFLKARFPDADVDSFFGSFSWEIPVKEEFISKKAMGSKKASDLPRVSPYDSGEGISRKKVKDASRPSRTFSTRNGKAAGGGGNEEHVTRKPTRKSTRPMAQSSTAMDMDDIVDLCSDSDEADLGDPTTMGSANSQTDSAHASSSAAYDSIAHSVTREKLQAEAIPETFDDYLKSLDDILRQPPRGVGSPPATVRTEEARKRLSEVLGMDLRTLLSSKALVTEIQFLSSALQRGSSLNARELAILRLIDEIPLSVKDFEKAEKVKADAEKFFVDLAANVAHATNLRSEYSESKNKAALLQTKFNSVSSAIEEMDKALCYIQGRRDQASYAIEKNKRDC